MKITPTKINFSWRKILVIISVIAVAAYVSLWFTAERQLHYTLTDCKNQRIPMTVADILPASVADTDNAAPVLLEMIASVTNIQRSIDQAFKPPPDFDAPGQWPDEQKQKIKILLTDPSITNMFTLVYQAAAKSACQFDIDYRKGPLAENLIGSTKLTALKNITRLIGARAVLSDEGENAGENGALILNGLRLSWLLEDNPVLIYTLVAMNMEDMLLNAVKAVSLTDESAYDIIKELKKHEDTMAITRAWDGERVLFGMWVFERMLDSENHPFVTKVFPVLGARIVRMGARPLIKMDYAGYLAENLLVRQALLDSAVCWSNLPELHHPWYAWVSRLSPPLRDIANRWVRHSAHVNVVRAGLAVQIYKRQHGLYPDALHDLVPDILATVPSDPYTGLALIYGKVGDGIMIYSCGPDQKDDGGQPWNGKKMTGDIVWKFAMDDASRISVLTLERTP